jgi:tetratricopeptide (TPR) repeat protein
MGDGTLGRRLICSALVVLAAGLAPAAADIVPRASPVAGSVIAHKVGEEVRFVDVSDWRFVDLRQDVVAGDYLRTNATGSLAVLFSDRTQMRLGRNTTLLVKQVGDAADSAFSLESGTIWARAERGGGGLTIDTPAAAAAIRGTDWSLTVDASGKTSLIVLEGSVELANPQGKVTVNQGEAAVASIGAAPTKIFLVDSTDREQMLFYLSLRSAFTMLPASTLSSRDMRRERSRILALPEASRSAEDWLTLAEVSLSYDGLAAAEAAAAQTRTLTLSGTQRARLDLIEAMIAGADQRYSQAAGLFERAAPRLDRRRRAMALYGGYYARSLADTTRVEKPPTFAGKDGPFAAIAEAFTAGFLVDIKTAIAILKKAESRYPGDPTLPAVRAQLAILIDDRIQVEEAIGRSLELDPDDPTGIEAQANYRGGAKGDIEGAYGDLSRAIEIAPGITSLWNAMGLVQAARGARRESEAAFKKAIELEPNDPVAHANLALNYLNEDRVAEAKAEIDAALAADPAFDIGLIARGRYFLQIGEVDKARDDLLAGTTANPAYAQGLLLLAAAHYQAGDRQAAEQALENADRLDPNDPAISSVRASIAVDDYDADAAIHYAQEALRRTRARGGDYAAISASREAGSALNDAFRLAGLDAWGRYYGDVVFDPFTAAGFVDQSLAGSIDPFINTLRYSDSPTEPEANASAASSLMQALLLDPQLLASPSRGANLVRHPFVEASAGGGLVADTGDDGWTSEADIQAFQSAPFPWSVYGVVRGLDTGVRRGDDPATGQFDLGDEQLSGTGFVTAKPTPDDNVVAYVDVRDTDYDLTAIADPSVFPLGATLSDTSNSRSAVGGLGWSHTFGYRNVASIGLFGSDSTASSLATRLAETGDGPFGALRQTDAGQQSATLAAAHSLGIGDLTLRYGLEGTTVNANRTDTETVIIPFNPDQIATTSSRTKVNAGLAYVDALYELTPDVKLEAGLFGVAIDGESLKERRLDPRVGVAWSPTEGHYLRAGYLRSGASFGNNSLSPVGIVGLQPNQTSLAATGHADTFAARWDAEWTPNLFTSIDYQHQDLEALSIEVPASANTIDLAEGRIDRVGATANVWLGHGIGAFATYSRSWSKDGDASSPGFGGRLPFVADETARLGVTVVNSANVKVTLAATHIGERTGNAFGTVLAPYWTGDAFLTYEPFDKRFEFKLSAYNIFDTDFDVAPGTPGWGPTVAASFKVRF